MATAIQIPKVVISPSTTQYAKPKNPPKPFYTPRFKLSGEQWKKTLGAAWLRQTDPLMPRYPYGKNITFNEANFGLYGGATIQSGNKISKGRNKGKTKRKWFPNVRLENIRSEALDTELSIPITARALRTIKKCGGLDQYLLGEKPARIKELGMLGWKLRWHVIQSPSIKEKFAREREQLGLPKTSSMTETFAEAWNDQDRRKDLIDLQDAAWERLRSRALRFEIIVDETWKLEQRIKRLIDRMDTLFEHNPRTLELPPVVEEVGRGFKAAKRSRSQSTAGNDGRGVSASQSGQEDLGTTQFKFVGDNPGVEGESHLEGVPIVEAEWERDEETLRPTAAEGDEMPVTKRD